MDILFCDACDASVPGADLETGDAARLDGRLVCARCLPRARRARVLRIALIPIALLAAASAGAMIAVLLLSPRIDRLAERSRALDVAMDDSAREGAGISGEVRGLREVSAEQMAAIAGLRRAFEDGALETAELIRQVAGRAAGNGRQIRAVKELIARRIRADSATPQESAASSAAQVETWLRLIRSEDPGVRLSALVALEDEQDDRVSGAIGDALADDDSAIRAQAASMAGRRSLTEVLPALALLLEDGSVHVRQAAALAFEAISGKKFAYDATDAEEDRAKALEKMRAWLSRED